MMAQGTVKPLAWFTHHTVGKLGAGSLTPVGPGPMPLPIALWCGTECMLVWLTFLDYVLI